MWGQEWSSRQKILSKAIAKVKEFQKGDQNDLKVAFELLKVSKSQKQNKFRYIHTFIL